MRISSSKYFISASIAVVIAMPFALAGLSTIRVGNPPPVFEDAEGNKSEPKDGGLDKENPLHFGETVTFTATATDPNGDDYYFAVCKTDSITPQGLSAPVCNDGEWGIAGPLKSGDLATVTFTADKTAKMENEWFAFVCDRVVKGSGCSKSSQGSGATSLASDGGGADGSPFYVDKMVGALRFGTDCPDIVALNELKLAGTQDAPALSTASDLNTAYTREQLKVFVSDELNRTGKSEVFNSLKPAKDRIEVLRDIRKKNGSVSDAQLNALTDYVINQRAKLKKLADYNVQFCVTNSTDDSVSNIAGNTERQSEPKEEFKVEKDGLKLDFTKDESRTIKIDIRKNRPAKEIDPATIKGPEITYKDPEQTGQLVDPVESAKKEAEEAAAAPDVFQSISMKHEVYVPPVPAEPNFLEKLFGAEQQQASVPEAPVAYDLSVLPASASNGSSQDEVIYQSADNRKTDIYQYRNDPTSVVANEIKNYTIFHYGTGEENELYSFDNTVLHLREDGVIEGFYMPNIDLSQQQGAEGADNDLLARASRTIAKDQIQDLHTNGGTKPDFIIPAPYAVDSGGNVIDNLTYEITGDNFNKLKISFTSNTASYPVVLDPTLQFTAPGSSNLGDVITGQASGDQFSSSLAAGDFNYDGKTDLAVAANNWNSGYGLVYIFYNDGSIPTTAVTADVIIQGEASSAFGSSIAAGDFNGDGKTDFAVGAQAYSSNYGRAYIFYNDGTNNFGYTTCSGTPTTCSASNADVIINGETSSGFGSSLAAGNFDSDSDTDLVVGARSANSGAGKAYIFYNDGTNNFGYTTCSGTPASCWSSQADVIISGESGSSFGSSLAAGNFDSDSDTDLAVGGATYSSSAGRAYIFYNDGTNNFGYTTCSGTPASCYASQADVIIDGESGSALATLISGDFNADGKTDLVAGGPNYSTNTGRAYIFYNDGTNNFGTTTCSGTPASCSAANADVIITGETTSNYFGRFLAVGDFNMDGRSDLAVSSPGYSTSKGRAYIFYNDGSIPTTASTADVIITGESSNTWFGAFAVGDFNADNNTDLAVGDPMYSSSTGRAYIFYGEGGLERRNVITGESSSYFGVALASGDFNYDGKTDLAVGARTYSSNTGRAYIFYNDGSMPTAATSADVTITGESGSYFGWALTGGDFNYDSKIDLAVTAPNYNTDVGRAYIFYNDGSIPTSATSADVIITGESGSNLGGALAAGDFNYDGTTDLVVSSVSYSSWTGRAYIFNNDGSIPTSAASADVIITGETGSWFGVSLTAGDFNYDSRIDLAVGGDGYNYNQGRAYIFNNDAGGMPTAAGSADKIITGENTSDYFGVSVAAGDFNYDGRTDLAVGATGYYNGDNQGRAYIFNNDTGGMPTAAGSADNIITGETSGDQFGMSLTPGDFNADGRIDLAVGAHIYSTGTGRVYILYNDGSIPTTAATADVKITGEDTYNYFGRFPAAGDFNGDGRTDLAIGADGYSSSAGIVYIYYGEGKLGYLRTITGETSSQFGYSLAIGDFNDDGKTDLAVGANIYSSNAGRVYLFYQKDNFSTTATTADAIITGETSSQFGYSLAAADLNDDGKTDLAVGANIYSSNAGRAYIFYQNGSWGTTSCTMGCLASNADAIITGEAGSKFGNSLAAADLNDDGKTDLVIGASTYSTGTGRVYIFYQDATLWGTSSCTTGCLASDADVKITGQSVLNYFGSFLATGDFNDDGKTDLAVSANWYSTQTGRVYIFYQDATLWGTSSCTTGCLAANADEMITGQSSSDDFGAFLVTGDFNDDGKTDIATGALLYSTNIGRAYIFYQDGSWGTTSCTTGCLAANADVIIEGEATNYHFGISLAAGDFDYDGKTDLAVSSGYWSNNIAWVYIFYQNGSWGTTSCTTGCLAANADIKITGETGYFGNIVVAADFSNDNRADLAIGAYDYSTSAGKVYIYYAEQAAIASVPSAPTVGTPTRNTLNVNPVTGGTEKDMAIYVATGSSGNCNGTAGLGYVQSGGTVSGTVAWQTDTAWGTKTVTGLSAGTTYYFCVKARSTDDIETSFGTATSAATNANNDPTHSTPVLSYHTPLDSTYSKGYWQFEDGVSATAFDDETTNNNNGSCTNCPVWSESGYSGGAYSYNGSSNYITVTNNSSLNFGTGNFSISAWVKTTNNASQRIVSKRYSDASGPGYSLAMNSSGIPYIEILANSGYVQAFGGSSATDGNWHYIVGTVNRSGNGIVYIDGVAGTPVNFATLSGYSLDNSYDLAIGKFNPAASAYFNGSIDETHIYNRVLTSDEIKAQYLSYPMPSDATNLKGYWSLNDGSGVTSFNDETANNYDGTCTNCPDWNASGHSGGSYDFNGTNDYVTMGDVLDFENNNSFSLSAWIRSDVTGVGGYVDIISKQNHASPYTGYDMGVNDTTKTLEFELINTVSDDDLRVRGTRDMLDGSWHHVVTTYDGSKSASGVKLYVDGTAESTTTVNNNLTASTVTTFPLQIGGRNGANLMFNGNIDDARVYNTVLSANDVKRLYKGGTTYSTSDISVKSVNVADADSDATTTIVNWKKNGSSLAVLNMAFDTNKTSVTTDAIKDYSGNAYHGTLGGGTAGYAPTWSSTSGIKGGYYNFDGTDDYISMGDVADMGASDSFTLEAWVKWPVSPGGTDYQPIISKEVSSAFGYSLKLDNNSVGGQQYKPYILISGSTPSYLYGTSQLNDNQWHHIVGVADATDDSLKIYVDGVSQTGVSSLNSWTGAGNAEPLKIGAAYDSYKFKGTIDEVRIYKTALTAAQIVQNYNNGKPSYNTIVSNMCSSSDTSWLADVTINDAQPNTDSTTKSSNDMDPLSAPTLTSVTITDTSGFTNDTTPVITVVRSGDAPDYIQFSCNGGTNWSSDVLYGDDNVINDSDGPAWDITTGATGCSTTNESKTITARLVNGGGNSGTQNDSTYYDNTAPTVTMSSIANKSATEMFAISSTPTDGSGSADPYELRFSGDTCTGSVAEQSWQAQSTAVPFTDSDMEVSGISNWTSVNNAVVTKQTTDPHGGTQLLRVAYNGTADAQARSLVMMTVGKKYRITGWGKGDGTVAPRLQDGWPNIVWNGTSSTSWQYIDATGVASTSTFWVMPWPNNTTGYAEFDDITVTEIDTGVITGLSPNTQYSFKVKARDELDNESSYTACGTATYTSASTPGAPTVGSATDTTLSVNTVTGGAEKDMAIYVAGYSSTYCDGTNGLGYVQSDGSIGSTAVYASDATWGAKTVTGLVRNTTYYFCAKARNQDDDVTAFGTATSGTTSNTAPVQGSAQVSYHMPVSVNSSAYWQFEDGAWVTRADDRTANANDAYCTSGTNCPAYTSGYSGGGYNFATSDKLLKTNAASSLEITSAITVSAWVKLNTNTGQPIASKLYSAPGMRSWQLQTHTTHGAMFFVSHDGTDWPYTTGSTSDALSTGTWYFITGTYDGTDVKVYINGSLKGTTNSPGSIYNRPSVGVCIGGSNDCALSTAFDGIIDELHIYNRALSGTEISNIYNAYRTTPGYHAPLDTNSKAVFDFEDGNISSGISVVDDETSNNFNASCSGLTCPTWDRSGKVGGTFDFDGVNDYLSAGTMSGVDLSQSYSMSLWAKLDAIGDARSSCVDNQPAGLISKENGTAQGLQLDIFSNGTIYLYHGFSDTGYAAAQSSATFNTGQWYFITIAHDLTARSLKVYSNGTEIASATYASNKTLYNPTSSDFYIGRLSAHCGLGYTNGEIDEVQVYNRTLTADEIKKQYYAYGMPKKTDLAGEWKLDEGKSATSFDDSSSNSNTGSCSGGTCPAWSSAGFGNGSYDFDGTDDYINMGNNSSLNPASAITVASWVKWDQFFSDDTGHGFISKANGALNGYALYQNTESPYNKIKLFVNTGSNSFVVSNASLSTDTWYHTVMTYDGSNVKLYINGSFDNSNSATGSINWGGTVENLYFGTAFSSGGSKFDGKMDETQVYNRALSAQEIKALYESYTPAPVTNLSAHLGLDDGNGATSFNDETVNNYDGSCSGGACPAWSSSGIRGGAFDFDGTDDLITAGTLSSVDFAQSYTLSLWTKLDSFGDASSNCGNYRGILMAKEIANRGFDLGQIPWGTNANGKMWFMTSFSDDSYVEIDNGSALNSNQWYNVIIVHDAASRNFKMYVDGSQKASSTYSAGKTPFNPSSGNLNIGSGTINCADDYTDGKIDDIRVYSRALLVSEVENLYESTAAGHFSKSSDISVCPVNPSDTNSDALTDIINWKKNGSSIAVLNMPFDSNITSTSSNAIKDYSGNANHGTLGSGNPSYTPAWISSGIKGGAYDFDGVHDAMEIADNNSLDISGSLTLEAWVYLDSYPLATASDGAPFQILSKGQSTSNANFQWYIGNDTNQGTGQVNLFANIGSSWTGGNATSQIPLNQWVHLASVYNGSQIINYYNGTATTPASATGSVTTNSEPVYIAYGLTGKYLDGKIDEVRIYNSALTAAQIAQNYNSGKPNYNTIVKQQIQSSNTLWSADITMNDAQSSSADSSTENSGGASALNHAPVFDDVMVTDSSTTPIQILTDGDMEASGTTSWTVDPTYTGTISKQTGTRTDGRGSQVIRLAHNGTHDHPSLQQSNVLTIGHTYRFTGYARGDGTAVPSVYDEGAAWTGTSSTSWQHFDFVRTVTGEDFRLFATTTSNGTYAEFDDIVIADVGTIVPGETLKFTILKEQMYDEDALIGGDTLNVYFCSGSTTAFDYSANTCTGGTLLCSDTAVNPVIEGATCNDTQNSVATPTSSGTKSFKAYMEDALSYASTGEASQAYSVEDLPPTLVSYTATDNPAVSAGGSDTVTYSAVIQDQNGDTTVTAVEGYLFDDDAINLTSGACTPNEKNCYFASSCTINTAYGDSTQLTATCNATVWYNANASGNWEVHVNPTDGGGKVTGFADSSANLTNAALTGINIPETSIAYGSIQVGHVSAQQSMTVQNMGNQIFDVAIEGANMTYSTNSIDRSKQQWSDTTGFVYGAGYALVETASTTSAATGCFNANIPVRSDHTNGSGSDDNIYWLLQIPEAQKSGSYTGSNTFATMTCN